VAVSRVRKPAADHEPPSIAADGRDDHDGCCPGLLHVNWKVHPNNVVVPILRQLNDVVVPSGAALREKLPQARRWASFRDLATGGSGPLSNIMMQRAIGRTQSHIGPKSLVSPPLYETLLDLCTCSRDEFRLNIMMYSAALKRPQNAHVRIRTTIFATRQSVRRSQAMLSQSDSHGRDEPRLAKREVSTRATDNRDQNCDRRDDSAVRPTSTATVRPRPLHPSNPMKWLSNAGVL
jgi:hypothetical protein